MRTLTVHEYLIEQLNRRARERGEDVELVAERPKPQLATREGEVVQLSPVGPTMKGNANGKAN